MRYSVALAIRAMHSMVVAIPAAPEAVVEDSAAAREAAAAAMADIVAVDTAADAVKEIALLKIKLLPRGSFILFDLSTAGLIYDASAS